MKNKTLRTVLWVIFVIVNLLSFLVGPSLIVTIIDIIFIVWYCRAWRRSRKQDREETTKW